MINHLKKLFTILIPSLFVIFIIILYGKYKCDNQNFEDPLEKTIIFGIDGWSITHVTFFALLGYYYPTYFWYAFIWGVIWELCEYLSGKYKPKILSDFGECNKLQTDNPDKKWWYAKWTDIICNVIGFLLGIYMKTGKIKI